MKTGLEVREIGTDDAKIFSELVTSNFSYPSETSVFISSVIGKDNWKHYLAYYHDRPVATGSVFFNGDIAWISDAATHAEYRNMGAQGALIAKRISAARSAGCDTVTTETAEDNASYRNMLRYGFRLLYKKPNFVHEPLL